MGALKDPDSGKQNNFLVHGGILALASVAVRFIGMIYRIPLVNIIGSVGNGYYSTAYSVYSILLLFSSYSLPLAVSKMVSERVAEGKWREVKNIMSVAFLFAVLVGTAFGALTYFLSDFFCAVIMKSPLAAIPLRFLAPTVFIVAVVGVLRGFFQGLQTTIPTAVSQILEQVVNALVSVSMAYVLFRHGELLAESSAEEGLASAWGAAGGTIGTGAGALTALLFCLFLYFAFKKHFRRQVAGDRHRDTASRSTLFRVLLATAVPVILSTAAYNCIDIIDVAVFNNACEKQGILEKAYTAVWGDYNSAFLLLLHLPVAFASAIASALVPSLTSARAAGDRKGYMRKMNLTVKVTLVIALPCSFALMAIGGDAAKLLFTDISDESALYLTVGGIAVAFQSLSTVTNAILQSLDHMERPVLHAVISLCVHVLLLLLLLYVFRWGIYAVIVSYTVYMISMCALNLISIHNLSGYRMETARAVLIPGAASVIVAALCLIIRFSVGHFLSGRLSELVIVCVSAVSGVALYGALILLTGCFSRRQLLELPGGGRLASLSDRLRYAGRR